jgi:SAM-dependent methyltransferase
MPEAERCAWCGAPLPAGGSGWSVARCNACGVGTTSPWPSDTELEAAYGTAYRPDDGRFAGPGDRILSRTRGLLARRIDKLAPPGPVLDVGAGDGSLLRALQSAGREAVGLERGATQNPAMRDAEVGELEGGWAAIVFWHSLEHLRDPSAALAAAAERLLPGGLLIVAVPNLGSVQARVFGTRWLALDLPRHLTHLTARALTLRLRGLGLQLDRVSHWRGGQSVFGWLHGFVGALPGSPNLYDALRRPAARMAAETDSAPRLYTLVAAVALLPVAAVAAALETVIHRGGTVHVEARRHT